MLQQGQAYHPLVLHPDRFPYAEKSLIVYKIDAYNLNVSLVDASYVTTSFPIIPFALQLKIVNTHQYHFQEP